MKSAELKGISSTFYISFFHITCITFTFIIHTCTKFAAAIGTNMSSSATYKDMVKFIQHNFR